MRTALYKNGLFVNDKFRMENVLPAMGQRPLSRRSQSRVEQSGGGIARLRSGSASWPARINTLEEDEVDETVAATEETNRAFG